MRKLPQKVRIPKHIIDKFSATHDDGFITDFLSDTYGFAVDHVWLEKIGKEWFTNRIDWTRHKQP